MQYHLPRLDNESDPQSLHSLFQSLPERCPVATQSGILFPAITGSWIFELVAPQSKLASIGTLILNQHPLQAAQLKKSLTILNREQVNTRLNAQEALESRDRDTLMRLQKRLTVLGELMQYMEYGLLLHDANCQ